MKVANQKKISIYYLYRLSVEEAIKQLFSKNKLDLKLPFYKFGEPIAYSSTGMHV